jgi:hypothetical protein
VQHGPAGIAATPTEPKHLGTRLHRWNHAKGKGVGWRKKNVASSENNESQITAPGFF